MSTIDSPPTNHPGSAPGRAPGPVPTSIAVASYCRVTFDRPPINTITATTVAELIGLVEQDPALQVVVFDSANPALYLAHYDVDNDPGRTAALGLGPTPTISMHRAQSSAIRKQRKRRRPARRRSQRDDFASWSRVLRSRRSWPDSKSSGATPTVTSSGLSVAASSTRFPAHELRRGRTAARRRAARSPAPGANGPRAW